jgi:AhpD family alkylhydroperoxidase
MTTARKERSEFAAIAPAAEAALIALSRAAADSGLDKQLLELVKLRASQINGCVFCVQYHLNLARKLGAPAAKLDLMAVWREAGVYSARERAALAWTETLTELAHRDVPDAAYAAVREQFSEEELVFLSTAIAAINAWNRLGAGFRFSPPPAA